MKPGTSFVFNLAAAAAGTALLALLGAVGGHHQTRDLILTLVAFVLVVLVMNNQESLVLVMQRSGRWQLPAEVLSTWTYASESGQVVNNDRIKLRQVGRLVRGYGETDPPSDRSGSTEHRYRIRGSLNPEGILEGRWESLTGSNYYGSFQLVAQRDGEVYAGRWTGVSRQNHVRAGEWEWLTVPRRATRDLTRP